MPEQPPVPLSDPPRGLALPAERNPGGYFTAKSAMDTAWGDLLIALLTPIGARPMRRQFGSGLYELLFEPDVPATWAEIEMTVREAAARHVPHVQIHDVAAASNERGVVQLHITFGLTGNRESERRRVFVRQEGGFDVTGLGTE